MFYYKQKVRCNTGILSLFLLFSLFLQIQKNLVSTSSAQEISDPLINENNDEAQKIENDLLQLIPEGESILLPEKNIVSVTPSTFPTDSEETDKSLLFERLTPQHPQEYPDLTQEESAWGHFSPGSWIRTRTVGTAFQFGQAIRSVTETKLTLLSLDEDGYQLLREVFVKMGNRTFQKTPETIKYNFYDIEIGDSSNVEMLQPMTVQAGLKVIPCCARRFSRHVENMDEITTIWYSSVTAPYIIQKQTRTLLPGTNQERAPEVLRQSLTTLLYPATQLKIGGVLSWRTKTIEKKNESLSLTYTFHSSGIPGGIQREITTETDPKGAKLYQSTTILLDYYAH